MIMINDMDTIQYTLVRDYNYPLFFQDYHFENKVLSDEERAQYAAEVDELVEQYIPGLKMMNDGLKDLGDKHDTFSEICRAEYSLSLFVLFTMIDSLVAAKLFVQAKSDYEKSFLRGKLRVLMNEGFKKLYGFADHSKSEWIRLAPFIDRFPPMVQNQYQILTRLLDDKSKSFNWWKEERDAETHQDAEALYNFRTKDISESEVMEWSLKLFEILLAINHFLSNVNACILGTLYTAYQQGQLKE